MFVFSSAVTSLSVVEERLLCSSVRIEALCSLMGGLNRFDNLDLGTIVLSCLYCSNGIYFTWQCSQFYKV